MQTNHFYLMSTAFFLERHFHNPRSAPLVRISGLASQDAARGRV